MVTHGVHWRTVTMNGVKCRCGFATTARRLRCPRCGKHMKVTYWPNQGRVLAFIKLDIIPTGQEFPMDLLMLEVEDGPKFICWTDTPFSIGERVTFVQLGSSFICSPSKDFDEIAREVGESEGDGGDTGERESLSQ